MKRNLLKLMAISLAICSALLLGITINESKANANDNLVPIYRLYNDYNKEHLYTSDAHEKDVLYSQYGWGYEGVGWYAPKGGTPVYRLYNGSLHNHLYTTDLNEIKTLTSKYGWVMDNNGNPLFYSGGNVGIYRLYLPTNNGLHHMTTDTREYNVLPGLQGWKQEGLKLYAAKIGNPIKRFSASAQSNTHQSSSSYEGASVNQVVALVNIERRKAGLSELATTRELTNAANVRVKEISSVFSHTRPNGSSCFSALDQANVYYMCAAENIACGQPTSVSVMDSWMNSSGHRRNILNPRFNHIGVACQLINGTYYWVQEFSN